MIVFIVIILAMIGVFSLRLYKTQATVTEESLVAADADSMTYQSTVEAARGNILDRNGNALVSNRASYNLVIVNFVFFNAPDPNGNLLKVLDLCDELGIQYESHFPVTPDRPYEYTDDNNSAWQENFRKFLADRGYDLDISAPTLMKRLRSEYKIPDDWKQADVYRIIAVRYELELRSIEGVGLENYTLAEDVDAESLAAVMELAVPGVVVENGTVREYNTKYAAHILGYIGPIWSAEADEYREKGYSMNALVGKSGVEQAFEQYLHGSSGLKKTTVSSTGEILNRYYVTEPVPGNNVELSIDISLQAVAEQSLEKVILDLRENGVGRNKEGKDARGGAVVVQACKTGEILAMASYPTYDISTFNQDYETLSEDEMNPLFNRALTAYPPGSVYKMVTSIAAVDLGGFDPGYIIEDKGLYTYYDSFQPKCHIWSLANPRTHGKINLMQAIARVNRVCKGKEGGLVVDYIGIARALKQAMKDYTKRDQGNYGNMDVAATAYPKFLEKLDVCRDLLYGFNYGKLIFTDKKTQLAAAIAEGTDWLLDPMRREDCEEFLKQCQLMNQALSLCKSLVSQEDQHEAAYLSVLRVQVLRLTGRKAGGGKGMTYAEFNKRVTDIMKQTVHADGVLNLFDGKDVEISLFDEAFLTEVANMKEKNVAVESLKRLIKERVRAYQRTSVVKAQKFSDMLQGTLNSYLNGMLTNAQVIEELVNMAHEMMKDRTDAEKLGLSDEEIAFYDAITKPQAVHDFYNNDQLVAITRELTETLQKSATIDWQKKESARAGMRRAIKRLLRKYKYPPEGVDDAMDTVMRQCELWADGKTFE